MMPTGKLSPEGEVIAAQGAAMVPKLFGLDSPNILANHE
jgi:hypothetical protein